MHSPSPSPFKTASRAVLYVLSSCVCAWSYAVPAQVFTVSTEHVDGRALTFQPTSVPLPTEPANVRTRQELMRSLQSEQGFAMRPLPLTSKGVTLVANGPLSPEGSDYVVALQEHGISSKTGDRVTITDVKIKGDRVAIELNGGPDHKHKYLRHVQVGAGGGMTSLGGRDDGAEPVGSRVTLIFPHALPNVSGAQIEALLAPVINFGLKSSSEAYAESLPPLLKKAVLDHHVLVGMSSEMVLHAVGQPQQKIREREGQMPFEEWIYGAAPERVEFVRLNNERVIRVEDALVGETPVVRASNEVGDYWSTQAGNVRMVKLGDEAPADRAQQNKTAAAPSLRRPGEVLASDKDPNRPTPQPVQFPKGMDKVDKTGSMGPAPPPATGTPAASPATASPGTATPATATPASPSAGPAAAPSAKQGSVAPPFT